MEYLHGTHLSFVYHFAQYFLSFLAQSYTTELCYIKININAKIAIKKKSKYEQHNKSEKQNLCFHSYTSTPQCYFLRKHVNDRWSKFEHFQNEKLKVCLHQGKFIIKNCKIKKRTKNTKKNRTLNVCFLNLLEMKIIYENN